ncbi:MAG: TrmH family RNA methyltransferase [bacterium]
MSDTEKLESVEGRISVMAALHAGKRVVHAILVKQDADDDALRDVLALAAARRIDVRRVGADEIAAHAHGASHGGVLALCEPKPLATAAELLASVSEQMKTRSTTGDAPLLLLLEGADDARNLGFTLRSADAFGAHAVLLKKRAWDFDSVEVARPSSGAYERMPIVLFSDTALIAELRGMGLKLIGCLANVQRTLYGASLDWPTILAIGGEKRGLSAAVRDLCDRFARIPTREGASLSLSHAASVALAEAARQRFVAHAARAGDTAAEVSSRRSTPD